MDRRLSLHNLLVDTLGSSNVYFQPPESIKMQYPAIVYSRDYVDTNHANNRPYHQTDRYQIILIDQDPDSEIIQKLKALPMCEYDRHYAADNLNHDVFTIYY